MIPHLFQIWFALVTFGLLFWAVSTAVEDYRELRARRKQDAIYAIATHRVQTKLANGQYRSREEYETDFEFEIIALTDSL